jgi:hypothetical protein
VYYLSNSIMSLPPLNDTPATFYSVVNTLEASNISLENLIRRSLLEPGVVNSQYITNFLQALPRLLDWLVHQEITREIVTKWMKNEYTGTLTSQLQDLTKPDKGLHLNATSIIADELKECTIEKIAQGMQTYAPDVWELVGKLLDADPALARHREKERERREKVRIKNANTHNDKTTRNEPIFTILEDDEDEPDDVEDQIENQRLTLLHIVSVSYILHRFNMFIFI